MSEDDGNNSENLNDEFEPAADGGGEDEMRLTTSEANRTKSRELVNQQEQVAKDETQEPGENNAEFNTDDSGDSGTKTQGKGGASNLWRHGISDKDTYLSFKPKGPKDPRTGQRTFKPEQLEMIVMAALNKGWDGQIAIYRGNKIDGQLTSQIDNMLKSGAGSGVRAFAQNRGLHVPSVQLALEKEPPPWLKSNMAKQNHDGRYRDEQLRNSESAVKSFKKSKKRVANFDDKDQRVESERQYKEGLDALKGEVKKAKDMPRGWLGNKIFGSSSAGAATENTEQPTPDNPQGGTGAGAGPTGQQPV